MNNSVNTQNKGETSLNNQPQQYSISKKDYNDEESDSSGSESEEELELEEIDPLNSPTIETLIDQYIKVLDHWPQVCYLILILLSI